MSRVRRLPATAVAFCVAGMVACTATIPSPTPLPTPSPDREPSANASASSVAASLRPTASEGGGDLGAELDIQTLDSALTDPMLDFVSDGASILYSSGRGKGSGLEAAPDLWRYTPGPDAVPELLWRNPERNHTIPRITGDLGMIAFVEFPMSGERAWNLWLIPDDGADAILLDTHPGDADVSSLVPSVSVYRPLVVWTAFDRGPQGPVSQLLMATAPDWEPVLIAERLAAEAELWLPSLYGSSLVYCEVRYSADRTTDQRFVYLLDLADPAAEPRRLDSSGRATMPLIRDDDILWKEADPGFNMFNWGTMYHHDLQSGVTSPLSTWPQEYVNYPSMGARFVAWWGADSAKFGVYDLGFGRARLIEIQPGDAERSTIRAHVSGDLLVWMEVDNATNTSELRYAYLPAAGTERTDDR